MKIVLDEENLKDMVAEWVKKRFPEFTVRGEVTLVFLDEDGHEIPLDVWAEAHVRGEAPPEQK
jgi:hypothetical protein